MAGRLMLTMEESSVAMKTPTPTIASTTHLPDASLGAAACCGTTTRAASRPAESSSRPCSGLRIVTVASYDWICHRLRFLINSIVPCTVLYLPLETRADQWLRGDVGCAGAISSNSRAGKTTTQITDTATPRTTTTATKISMP